MSPAPSEARLRTQQAQEVLLRCLQDSSTELWPGGDGLTIDDVLADYSAALAAGRVPDPHALQERYPELAGELAAFFVHETAAH
jgi:hypothetical protein